MVMGQNFESVGHLSITQLRTCAQLRVLLSLPAENSYGVTGELSSSNELLNAFLDRF